VSSPGLPQRLHASILEIALPSANSRSMVALFLLRPPGSSASSHLFPTYATRQSTPDRY
jgi:hypothetical protein